MMKLIDEKDFGSIVAFLWGSKAKFSYLLVASFVLLFSLLGAREIWTQEHRWADVVLGMFYRHDFLHPYLDEIIYYDKPLFSYWLIAIIAKFAGSLNAWVLRLPSAFAGLLTIWVIYYLGTQLKNKEFGLLSGWLLLTTYYFVFWSRTCSSDMLNLVGSLSAVAWYCKKRENIEFFAYSIFFMILALTSLCKGLVGAAVPLIVIFADLCLRHSWKKHFNWRFGLALIPAIILYVIPFWASNHFASEYYKQSSFYLVYRENFIRYFNPFDHRAPIYIYLVYFPIYLLPWAIFLIPALWMLKSRWKSMSINSKWIAWSLLLLFLFFSLSGSRRSYYILPMVPFGILFIADWMDSVYNLKKQRNLAILTISFLILLFFTVVLMPAWFYSQFGINRFAVLLKNEANKVRPWPQWKIILLDAESKLNFYLQLPPNTERYEIGVNDLRENQTFSSIQKSWPILLKKPINTIFISRKLHAPLLQGFFEGYRMITVSTEPNFYSVKKDNDVNAPIAFIPR